jgi:aminocarboxymuconate-semialdehyde decarboxylase
MNEGFCACGLQHDPSVHKSAPKEDETSEVLLFEVGRDSDKPLRFDLHSHILPKQWPSLTEKYGEGENNKRLSFFFFLICSKGPWIQLQHTREGYANMMRNGKFFREIYKNSWDSETRLKECDQHGIDVQVLSTVPVMFSYWAKPEHTLDLSRYLNDNIAQTCSENPKRYAGLGTLPLQSPELAVKELRRLHDDLGLQGVQIGTNVLGKNLDHPDLYPVFEELSDMGACVFVHPWDMMGQG